MARNVKGPTIDIGVSLTNGIDREVDNLVNQIAGKLSSMKSMGLDKIANKDISRIEKMLDDLKQGFDNLSHTKVNTSSFSKAQKDILDRITALEEKTSDLEQNFETLLTTMTKADGTAFKNLLSELSSEMKNLSDVTKNTVSELNSFSTGASKKELTDLKKILDSILRSFDEEKSVTNYRKLETALAGINTAYQEYLEIQDKIRTLQNAGISSIEDETDLANLQKQLVEIGETIQTLIDNGIVKFGESFDFKKIASGNSIGALSFSIDKDLDEIIKTVAAKGLLIDKELNKIRDIPSKQKKKTNKTDNNVAIKVDVATTKEELESQLKELLDSIKPFVESNPIEVGVKTKLDEQLSGSEEDLKNLLQEAVNLALQDTSNLPKEFKKQGKSLSADFAKGIKNGIPEVISAVKEVLQAALDTLKEGQSNSFIDVVKAGELLVGNSDNNSSISKIKKNAQQNIDIISANTSPALSKNLKSILTNLEKGDLWSHELNKELRNALENLGFISNSGDILFSSLSNNGARNRGVFSTNELVLVVRGKEGEAKDLINAVREAKEAGANVAEIVGFFNQGFQSFEFQEKALGENVSKLIEAGDFTPSIESLTQLVKTVQILFEHGLTVDIINDNILFDKKSGTFTPIDLATQKNNNWLSRDTANANELLQKFFRRQGASPEILSQIEDVWKSLGEGNKKLSNTAKKIKEVKKTTDEAIDSSKKFSDIQEASSKEGLDKEAQKLNEISQSAEKASVSKEDFAKANSDVLQSIIESLNGLKNEGEAFSNLNKLINNLSGTKGTEKLEKTKEALSEIVKVLSSNVDDASIINALSQIASNGSNLSDIAAILKASKKDLLEATDIFNSLNSDELDELLKNHTQEIVRRAKQELSALGGDGSQIINISELQKTKDGVLEIVGLVRTADDALQEFTLHTKDGVQMQNVAMSENTAKIAKQMKIYAQVQQFFERMQAQGKRVTDEAFFDKNADPALWQMLIDYAKQYHAELGDILSITMQTREVNAGESLLQSFSLNGRTGHLTVGPEGETVASRQQLLDVETLEKRIIALSKRTKEYYNLVRKQDSVGWNKSDEKILKEIENEYSNIVVLVKEYSQVLGDSTDILDKFDSALAQMSSAFSNKEQTYIDKSFKSLNDALNNPQNKNIKFTNTFNEELSEAISKVQELQTLINQHANTNSPWSNDELARLRELHVDIDDAVLSIKDLENIVAKSTSVDKLLTKINKDLVDQSAMPERLRRQYIELRNEIDITRQSFDGLNKVDFTELENRFQSLHEQITRLNPGVSLLDQIAKAAKTQSAQFIARYFSLQDMIRYTRELAQNVINIDSAITELRKVSDASNERLSQSFEESAKTAQELGQTIQHVINVTADWARLGYNVDQAEELARITALFTTVGDNMSADDASSYLISTLQGFQLATNQAEAIVDKYNEVECCLLL